MNDETTESFRLKAGLRTNSLERELVRLTREEVRKSPRLYEEYCRRHKWDWLKWVAWILGGPLVLFSGLVLMPLSFTAPLHIPLAIPFLPHDRFDAIHVTLPLLLGGQGLCVAAIVLLFGVQQTSQVVWQTDLFRAALLPVSDRKLHFERLRSQAQVYLPYLSYVFALLMLSAVLITRPAWPHAVLLALAAPLNAWHVLALANLSAARIAKSNRPSPVLLLVWLFFFLPFLLGPWFGALLGLAPEPVQECAGALGMALPTGWVNGAVYYLAIDPHPAGVAYLALIIVTWTYAARRLWRGFAIREILMTPAGFAPVFERGFPNPREIEQLYAPEAANRRTDNPVRLDPVPSAPAPTPDELQQRAAQLLSNSWAHRGWVERVAGHFLSPRERTILEQVFRGRLFWTSAYLVGVAATAPIILLLALPFFIDRSRVEHPRLELLLVFGQLAMFVFMEMIAVARRAPLGGLDSYGALHPVHPIGWREFRRAARKLLILRLVLWTPPILADNLVLQALVDPGNLPLSMAVAVGCLLAAYAMIDTLTCFVPTQGAADYNAWGETGRLMRCLVFSLLGFLPIAAVVLIAARLSETGGFIVLVPVGCVLLCSCAYVAQKYAEWVYHRTELDFQCREAILPDPRRR